MATMTPSFTELSAYALEILREGAEITLCRGLQPGNPSSASALALAGEQPSPQSPRRLEHECSLAAELDSAWAATHLAVTRHNGRIIPGLEDGESLDRVLELSLGQPLDLTRFPRIANGLGIKQRNSA